MINKKINSKKTSKIHGMVNSNTTITRYLNRINYKGSRTPNLEVLKELQRLHLLHVPFENLDIYNEVPIELSVPKFFEKIVHHRRGGLCYELNALFHELLLAMGFEAKLISGCTYNPKKKAYRRDFSHLAIIVRIDHIDYLVDVGFGEFSFVPLKVECGIIQKDERGLFTIDKYNKEYLKVARIKNNHKKGAYLFSPEPRQLTDFWEMCIFQQMSPESSFTQKRLISLATENGRITVSGDTLIINDFGRVKRSKIKTETEYKDILSTLFYKKEEVDLSVYDLVG